MIGMAKQKPSKTQSQDRHQRAPVQVRLHPLLQQQLDAMVTARASKRSVEIVTAIREHLERAGFWPPPSQQ
jgi:hypothetical protein